MSGAVSAVLRARLVDRLRSCAFVGWFGHHTLALEVPPSNTGSVRSLNSSGVRVSNAGLGAANAHEC